ncbi:hypothetical protein WSK_1634 [Novosphingobium sp. Rr 2-17]|uniref:DoxX family protein n=1 Tax=Novosphingobium sp. Rr 2-17 TaxID=555793 RepID=UPI0002699E95|nr:DoxX family protein [Novosphingobium sp. Rr 2-17]EIZ79744.1 hypothetical protein WSK_1634 [Novosphingobium sp. Rr 2-17]
MSKIAAIIGRFLIALIFIASGAGKLMDVAGTNAAITAVGLPSGIAIPVGVFELVAGLCLAAGFMVRLASVLLAIFTALTILFYHNQVGDPTVRLEVFKHLAIIGGLALAFAHSHMWSHYYAIRTTRDAELDTRDAEARVHEAELRAARAEARADAAVHDTPVVTTTTPGTVTTGTVPGTVTVRQKRRLWDW